MCGNGNKVLFGHHVYLRKHYTCVTLEMITHVQPFEMIEQKQTSCMILRLQIRETIYTHSAIQI